MSYLDCIWKERRLPLPMKIRVYLALVQSVLDASETWTLTSADTKSMEAFHMKCQLRILRISWRQFVCNSEISALTGLRAITDVIRHRRIAVLATSPDCRTATQHIKPYSLTSSSHSVVFPIHPGVVGLVAHLADGSTKSETTPARHLPTSGDRPLDAVIVDKRRDGPRWLCDDDDDNDDDDDDDDDDDVYKTSMEG